MIRQVIDRVNKEIDYSFKDVLRGVVYPVLHKNQLIPGDRQGMAYEDAVPNQARKSILYWEDYGTAPLINTPRYTRYQTTARLIVWMNFGKIKGCGYDECVNEILNAIPKRIGNEIFIIRSGQLPKTAEIFARYSYREGKQYVAPPFDVAAFNFNIRYMSNFCTVK